MMMPTYEWTLGYLRTSRSVIITLVYMFKQEAEGNISVEVGITNQDIPPIDVIKN